MTRKRMFMEMAVGLAMLSALALFGRARISRLQDEVTETPREVESPARAATPAASSAVEGPAVPALEQGEAESSQSANVAPPQAVTEPPLPPDPQKERDSIKAEVAALGPLHDELIEVLEAIHEALTDPEEKRQARDRVTMARLAKRQQMSQLEADAAAEPEWRVQGARGSAERARARLERQIKEARAQLDRTRQAP